MRFCKTDNSNNNDEIEFNESYNYKSDNDIEKFNCCFGYRRNNKRRNDI